MVYYSYCFSFLLPLSSNYWLSQTFILQLLFSFLPFSNHSYIFFIVLNGLPAPALGFDRKSHKFINSARATLCRRSKMFRKPSSFILQMTWPVPAVLHSKGFTNPLGEDSRLVHFRDALETAAASTVLPYSRDYKSSRRALGSFTLSGNVTTRCDRSSSLPNFFWRREWFVRSPFLIKISVV